MSAKPSQLKTLTTARYLAALWVCLLHFAHSLPGWHFVENLTNLGFCGVPFFFILSGFVLAYTYDSQAKSMAVTKFYLARFARIYPAYILSAVLFIVLLKISPLTRHFPITVVDLATYATATQAWFVNLPLPLNFVGWTIAVEALFYLQFPFLVRWTSALSPTQAKGIIAVCVAAVIAFGAVFTWVVPVSQDLGVQQTLTRFVYYFPLVHLPAFLSGCCLVPIFRGIDHRRGFYEACLAVSVVAGVVAIGVFRPEWTAFYRVSVFFPIFLAAIFSLAMIETEEGGLQLPRLPVLLGEASYSLYIFQICFMMLLHSMGKRLLPDSLLNGWPWTLFELTCISGMSIVSYRFLEIPARKAILSRFSRSAAQSG